MKKLKYFALIILIAITANAQVFISEYIEGGSFNKAIEIYNGDTTAIDLSSYRVVIAYNGSAAFSDSLVMVGTLDTGDVFVLANSGSVTDILDVTDTTDNGVINFNGDDFIALQEDQGGNWVTIDQIGVLGVDPGSYWSVAGGAGTTQNYTLVRKDTVTAGNTDWASSAGTDTSSSEWRIYPQDTFNYLGQHPGSTPPPAPTLYTIAEIQETPDGLEGDSPHLGEYVQTYGIVTAASSSAYFLQDTSAAWSGIYVYSPSHTAVVGDSVEIFATVGEYSGLTQLTSVQTYNVLDTGVVLPDPIQLPADSVNAEKYESVLVSVAGFCNNPDLGYGEWSIKDTSGVIGFDDLFYDAGPVGGSYYEVTAPLYYSFGAFKVVPRDSSDVTVTDFVSIHDIQFTASGDSPYDGQVVATTGIVTGVGSNNYFIQSDSGAWNGVYVYHSGHSAVRGDSIFVLAEVSEYYNLTELGSVSQYVVADTNVTLPMAISVGTDSLNNERYESVLVTTTGTCTDDNLGYGEWELDDGTGPIVIDEQYYQYVPTLGTNYTVTGPINYTYSAFKVVPRDSNDIVVETGLPDPEPSEYPTGLTSTSTSTSITLDWVDAGGAQLPDAYLILANTTGTFTAPSDTTPVSDDTDLSDDEGALNISFGVETATFTGLTPETVYYFEIYPYTNSGSEIDYKTDGTVPAISDTTLESTATGPPNIFFSEYIEGGSNRKALEIFNATEDVVDLSNIQIAQSVNGGGWQYYHIFPTGAEIQPLDVYVIITDDDYSGYFDSNDADEVLSFPSVVHFNGDDARALIYIEGTDTTMLDRIGDPNNDPGSGWSVAGVNNGTYNHTIVRKSFISTGNTNWALSAGTSAEDSEWIVYPQDTFDYLGEHTMTEPEDMPPIISNVERSVYIPYEYQDLTITAKVTDDNNILSSVTLHYGLNESMQSIPMTNTGGDIYSATISESVYSDGDLLGYYIEAVDNPVKGNKDTSAVFALIVGDPDIRDVRMVNNDVRPVLQGVSMRLTGVATVATGTFHPTRLESYIQDSTAGISVFNSGLTNELVVGHSYTVTGEIAFYNGLMELEPNASDDVVDNGPAENVIPTIVTIPELTADPEYYEGMLIELQNVSLSPDTPWGCSGSGSNLTFTSEGNSVTVRIDADTDICGADEPTWPVDLVGVVGQFDFDAPYDGGYQVLPRSMNDFMMPTDVDEEEVPITYTLQQNYPNPFNPSTIIKFSIPKAGLVTLKIYNILGEEVATLVNRELDAANHEVKFDASTLGSGVYLYRITAGEFTQTKKMLLVK